MTATTMLPIIKDGIKSIGQAIERHWKNSVAD